MITQKELKEKVGKNIWVIPIGNSVDRNKKNMKDQIEEVHLLSIGTKLMEINKINGNRIGKYPINGEYNSFHYGYLPFKTKEDAIKHLELIDIEFELKRLSWKHLSYEKIKEIEKIIKEKDKK